ncbi:MAG: sugar ABC transporter substrate-binding protein, partial [Actinobacteria bacterium]|nr:sugar ABC transporter substrate-binding protein [Actinomycetota bacterium]
YELQEEVKMKRMLKISVVFVLAFTIVLTFSLVGCKTAATTETTTAETTVTETTTAETTVAEEKEIVIGLAWDFSQNIARIAEEDFVRKISDEKGVRVMFTQADSDSTKQHSNIEDLISAKVDAIIAIPVDSKAIVSGIKLARDAGIYFICIDRNVSPDAEFKPDAFASTDSTKQAYSAGIALADILDKDGVKAKTLVLMGDLKDENAKNRDNGFRQAAQERGMEIVAEVPTEWNPEKALNGTTDAFMANPEINTIFIPSDFLLPGVQSVLQGLGKWIPRGEAGHIYIASQDVFPSGYKAVKGGYIDADTAWDIWLFAEKGVEAALALINGESLENPNMLVEGRVATKDNVDTIENLWGKTYSE